MKERHVVAIGLNGSDRLGLTMARCIRLVVCGYVHVASREIIIGIEKLPMTVIINTHE